MLTLTSTINDCQRLLDYMWNSITKDQPLNDTNSSIIGLWDSIINKAETVQILCDNKHYGDIRIIIRSFIEQYAYLKFILQRNTSRRAKVFLYHQRYTDDLNAQKLIDSDVMGSAATEFKTNVDNAVKATPAHRENLESELAYFKDKYLSFLPDGVKKQNVDKWYSFEKLNKYNSLKDLMNDLGNGDLYWLYKVNSNIVHGADAPGNIHLSNVDPVKGTTDVALSYSLYESDIHLIESMLGDSFFDLATYYRLLKQSDIKAIAAKMRINAALRQNNK